MQRIVVIGLAVLIGCSSRQGTPSGSVEPATTESAAVRRGCDPATDTTFAVAMTVYRACAVDREARAVGRRLETDFRPTGTSPLCYRAIVEFVVDEKGQTVPSTARVVRSSDSRYARAVIEAVPRWRFTPASRDGTPVAQVVQIDQWIQAMIRASGQPSPPPPSRPSC